MTTLELRDTTAAQLILSVASSLAEENWYAALAVALALPDICASCDERFSKNRNFRERYSAWYDTYVHARGDTAVSGQLCYGIRCAFLHHAISWKVEQEQTHKKWKMSKDYQVEVGPVDMLISVDQVQFCRPYGAMWFHENMYDNKLQLQVDRFCKEICDGAAIWLNETAGNAEVQTALDELLSIQIPPPVADLVVDDSS